MSKDKRVELVHKQYSVGSWHGKDAMKLVWKRFISIICITLVYLVSTLMLYFNVAWLEACICFIIIGLVFFQQYNSGAVLGERDVALGEIVYEKKANGEEVTKADADHCFHWFKGFFSSLLACLPFVIVCIVFAFIAKKTEYVLGVLPSWTENLRANNALGDALQYYTVTQSASLETILRVAVRIMVMPFLNIANGFGGDPALFIERISPVLVLLAPMCYGIGYTRGVQLRAKVNTSIKLGDDKKRRKARREKKKRQQQTRKKTEQLI